MKKTFILLAAVALLNSGCATIWTMGKPLDKCQTEKPTDGTHRKIHGWFLVWDICWGLVPAIVDLADHRIYKPCSK